MLIHLRKLSGRGDTIVEVMVVLAVLGLAIGISYATARRSLVSTRAAQEHSQATELLQSQIEQLYSLRSSTAPSPDIFSPANGTLWCIDNSSGSPAIIHITGIDPTIYANYPNPSACVNGDYYLSISKDPASDTFTGRAIWDDALGQGKDRVTIVYRVYP